MILALLATLLAAPTDLYVAPDGKDSNPGTLKRPLASLAGARDAVRKRPPGRDIRVVIHGGVYRLTEPVVFTTEDGNVTYKAAPGEEPVFDGGRVISAPDKVPKDWKFEQLYVNGRLATRARSPNDGFFPMKGGEKWGGENPFLSKPDSFIATPEVIKLLPRDLRNVVIHAYRTWDDSWHRIASVDAATNTIRQTGPYYCGLVVDNRFRLENFPGALDAPGEWYCADGKLQYIPLPGEDVSKLEFVAPVVEKFMVLRNVKNVRFSGLTFRHAGYVVPEKGCSPPQGACLVPGAITAEYCENVHLEDCRVGRIGGYAVQFGEGCRNCSVKRCLMEDLGAGGVMIGLTAGNETEVIARASDPAHATGRIEIDNNIIRNGGKIWESAVAVLVGHSGDNRITHNDISRMVWGGISLGFTWNYTKTPEERNVVSHNHVHHLGGPLADQGGIYVTGESSGTVISNNVVHDIDSALPQSVNGIYTDNSCTNLLIENNLVYNIRDGAYTYGSGKDNVVRNNILVEGPKNRLFYLCFYGNEQHRGVTIENNVFYGDKFEGVAVAPAQGLFRKNLYGTRTGGPVALGGKSFEEWQKTGQDEGSMVADPKFVDPAKHDYRLQPDSPAFKLGFKSFDPSEAGIYGSESWVKRSIEMKNR